MLTTLRQFFAAQYGVQAASVQLSCASLGLPAGRRRLHDGAVTTEVSHVITIPAPTSPAATAAADRVRREIAAGTLGQELAAALPHALRSKVHKVELR